MFKKKFRLAGWLIPKIVKEGKLLTTSFFYVRYLPLKLLDLIKERDFPLLAIVVSHKIEKKAVIRHRLKRRISEGLRLLLPQIKIPLALVFLARKKILKADYSQILADLTAIIKKINSEFYV